MLVQRLDEAGLRTCCEPVAVRAAGSLGAEVVAKSPPDGNTLYFGASPTLTISPHVIKAMTLDPARDLTAVSPVLSYANALVIHKELPISNLQELIAHPKAHPGKVFYGSAGMGASNHLSGELFAKQTGTQMNHVPYKGNAPAVTDVIASNGAAVALDGAMVDRPVILRAQAVLAQAAARPS
ncbi:Bug family tripartite tricarboxylate transporter substrate binding protein [Caldimonas mangrovi]|uniref:Bug family tripartite tricarboxylate transporter substrate binding protein n=1 Tax=Caldimonas mangrovi TaxID=2944811 RepID=UPI0034A3ADEF